MNLNDFIVNVFCETDDFMKKFFPPRTLRTRGPLPQLADSEVLTMEITGEFLGLDTDKAIVAFFKRFYSHYFPRLTCRVSFVRQAANLWKIKQQLWIHLARRFKDTVLVLDSLPIQICRFARAKRSKLFRGLARYGKEMGQQTFYGFRLHLKISSIGMVQAFDLAGANVHDIHMLRELSSTDSGLLLGDKAYYSDPLRQELLCQQGLEISVPTKYGRACQLPFGELLARKKIRRLIETVASQLVERFRIKKVWARDLWHLTNRVCRKILSHTFCILFCLRAGLRPLKFSELVTA